MTDKDTHFAEFWKRWNLDGRTSNYQLYYLEQECQVISIKMEALRRDIRMAKEAIRTSEMELDKVTKSHDKCAELVKSTKARHDGKYYLFPLVQSLIRRGISFLPDEVDSKWIRKRVTEGETLINLGVWKAHQELKLTILISDGRVLSNFSQSQLTADERKLIKDLIEADRPLGRSSLNDEDLSDSEKEIQTYDFSYAEYSTTLKV